MKGYGLMTENENRYNNQLAYLISLQVENGS